MPKKNKKGGFISTAISLGKKAVNIASKQPEIPCGQTKMFVKLNKRITKVLESDGLVNKVIKEGNLERVIISGKGFSRSPQPLMDGEWQIKIIKADDIIKYIVVINKNILKFEKYCKYQSVIQNISEGDEVEIVCIDESGKKDKNVVPGKDVKSDKFILHKFRTGKEGVLAFVAEFM